MTPCRVADTRWAAGPFGGPSIAGGTSRSFAIPNSACGVPSTALAYSLNITAVPQGSLGYLTVWPTGEPQPGVSLFNSWDGRVKANAAIIPAGANGAVSIFVTNTADALIDINGYFVPATDSSALAFYPLTPCRITDTRWSPGPLGGPSMTAGASRTFPILSSSTCETPSTAQAYSLNFTVVPPGPVDFLSTWPTGQAMPGVSTLNDVTGTIVANAAIVPAGASGSINVYVSNNTDVLIDINGYFAPPASNGLSLYTVTPCRVLDTRQPPGSGPINGQINVQMTGGACGIPTSASAFALNATVVPPGSLGYLTLWPQGQPQAGVSDLNAVDGALTSNLAIVPSTNGWISAFVSNPTQLLLDVYGYFAP
jgi:hypothetical protein